MLHKLCIYNNKIFVPFDAYVAAYSCKKSFISPDEKFEDDFRIKIPVKCMYIRDIRLYTIDDYITGLKALVILTCDYDGLCNAFIFRNAFKRKLFEIILPHAWIVIDYNYERYHNNIFVSDGPTFLYYSVNIFHIYSVPCGTDESFERCLFSDKDDKILQFKCFGPFYYKYTERFLSLLALSSKCIDKQFLKFVGFVSERGNKTIKCIQINTVFFFPQCYESIIKAVHVLKLIPDFKVQSIDVDDLELKETLSVICTTNDCLVFKNCVLKYCCKLTIPLMDIMCLKVEFCQIFKDTESLVLSFENKTVFFIKVSKNIDCQVIKLLSHFIK